MVIMVISIRITLINNNNNTGLKKLLNSDCKTNYKTDYW